MNNFKPLHEQISNKLIAALKDGSSIFQKPERADGASHFSLPLNPTTGNNYRGPSALILLMQNREDPRWMSLKQASFNKTPVEKGQKGTLINFYTSKDIQPVLDADGQPELKENGKPKTKEVTLDKPILKEAWLFNAEQLKDMPDLQTYLDAKNETGRSPEYTFAAVMDAQQFVNEVAETLPDDIRNDSAKVSLRQEIAAVLISSEMNVGYSLGDKAHQVPAWIALLEKEPAELFKAADDAQKIFDQVITAEKKDLGKTEEKSQVLTKGEVIAYNDKEYTVLSELKNKVLQMQEDTGRKFKLSPNDGLYSSLVEARNNPVEKQVGRETAGAGIAEEQQHQFQQER